jgi:putative ABC transport system permease protein
VYFKVIGLTQTSGAGEQAQEMSERIDLPFTTFQAPLILAIGLVGLPLPQKPMCPSLAEEKVIKLLKERHLVAPDDERAIGHWNMEKRV